MYWALYWRNLHWLSVNYPENPNETDKEQIKNLIFTMQTTGIGCSICRYHFIIWVNKNDINNVVKNRENLFTFFWNCHNNVNTKTGKKIWSYTDVYNLYTKKNWEEILTNESVNILLLFKNKKLKDFPSIYKNYWKTASFDKKMEMVENERKQRKIEEESLSLGD